MKLNFCLSRKYKKHNSITVIESCHFEKLSMDSKNNKIKLFT